MGRGSSASRRVRGTEKAIYVSKVDSDFCCFCRVHFCLCGGNLRPIPIFPPTAKSGTAPLPPPRLTVVRKISPPAASDATWPISAGGTGPSLKGNPLYDQLENESLYKVFTKIRDTMPPNFGTTLTDDAKLDVLAYILQVNGFPEGSAELKIDADQLDAVQIVRKGANRPAVPNFSIVEVVGCLAPGPDSSWNLTNASEPSLSKDQPVTSEELKAAGAMPFGTQTFRLVSVNSFHPDLHATQKIEAKGLIYRDVGDARLNVISLQMVAPDCSNTK